MALLTGIELAAWTIARLVGVAPLPLLGINSIVAFVALGTALVVRRLSAPREPGASWPAIICATMLVGIGASLFSALKYSIPAIVPFWLDPPLDRVERALFGMPPWQLLDSANGWTTMAVDRIYGVWLPTQLIILFLVILARPSPAKSRALTCYAAAWFLLGLVAATFLSSAGPIFYDRAMGGAQYLALHAALARHNAWMVVATSDAMWATYASGRPGLVSGISALPSMHVAISLWIVLTARALAPKLSPLAWAYFAFIWVASVQLGWHYASDGLAGCLGLAALWALSRPRPHSRLGSVPAP
jgi:hypothetical protein